MKAASSEWYNTKTRHVLPGSLSSGQRLFDGNSRYAGYSSSSSTRRSHSLSTSHPSGSTSTSTNSFSNRSSRSRSNSTTTEPTTTTTSSSTSTSTNANKYKGNRLFVPSIPETENSETEVAFTEDDEDDDEEEDEISSAHIPTDEASSTDQEEEDDEQVYRSFKNDLRMLKVQSQKSRSPSPAVSMRSVLTDLEEDEEDLPPDEVDDELQSTTEEEEEEEDEGMMTSNSNSTSSSYHSSSVPKSPVKVRVKVEKSVPHDDRVKVTVLLEESEISDEEEEDEDDEEEEDDMSEDTTTTAETVKYQSEDKDRTEGESYDESTEQGESESESEEELSEEEEDKKTDSKILSRFKDGEQSVSRIPQPQRATIPVRSHTVQETRNENSLSPKSSESNNSTSKRSSSSSETSSRSQSARSSLVGGVSSKHKMYSVGGKPRSLSARRSIVGPSPPHHPPLQIQLSVESPTPPDDSPATSVKGSSSSSEKSESRMNTADSSAVAMTKYVSLAPPGKMSLIKHHAKSLSAKSSRSREYSAALRQLSLGNLKEQASESEQSLPPIVPNKGKKKHPLLRTNTYIISSTVSEESSTQPSNSGSTPSQSSSQSSLQKTPKLDLSGLSASSPNKLLWASNSSSSQQSISDIVSALKKAPPAKDPSQVSFASEVMEHSLSTNSTSQHSTRSGSSSTSSSRASTGKQRKPRSPRGWPANKADVIHKEIITYGELEQASMGDDEREEGEGAEEDNRLRHHALNTIRQQMKHEMKLQRQRQKFHPTSDPEDEDSEEDDDDDDDDEDEDVELGSSSEYSEEEASTGEKKEKTQSHIPLLTDKEPQPGGETTSPRPPTGNQLTVPEMMTMSKDSETSKPTEGSEEQPHINKSEESGWSWKDEIGTNFDDDDDSPINSRIPSAESGYRAMPPSPASSKDNLSRQASLESQDLEKEKERLLEEWKRGGSHGAPPTITTTATSDGTMPMPGRDGIPPEDTFHLIRDGIDLTLDMPNEEKKIAVVWNEFNRDEQAVGAMADYEFSNLLDEMIQDTNNYNASTSQAQLNLSTSSQSLQVSNLPQSPSASPQKFHPSRKYQSFAQMVSLLSHNLRLVSSETLEDHMASLISLVSSILKKVRKNKSEDDYITQIACLSTIRVLCDRIQEMQTSQNLKYADLSWLFRILCKYSSDSDSKIRPEASFCLARLVKVAGPALVVRPIYFILVMESDAGSGKTTTGAKTKASAIDTLTYALLTFPKEDFHNLEEIAGWVCLSMLNEERRIRQSALECLAVIAEQLGRDKALPLFRTLFLKEEMDHFSRSPSPESHHTGKTGKSGKSRKTGGSDPVPISIHGTVRLLTGPGFPIALPIDAITARLDKNVLPVPSTKGLIEYAVNVPTGKDLVMLMTYMLDKADEEFDFSSSTDSLDSGTLNSKRSSVTSIGFSDIDWTGEGKEEKKSDEGVLISPDVAYILLGRGKVNKAEVVLLDVYKKEIIPELLKMFEKNKGKARNRKRWAKQGQKKKRKRKRRSRKGFTVGDDGEGGKPPIPTLSFDVEDDEEEQSRDEGEEQTQEVTEEGQSFPTESASVDDEVFEHDEMGSNISVVIDPPPEDQQKPEAVTEPPKEAAKPPPEPVAPKPEPKPGPSSKPSGETAHQKLGPKPPEPKPEVSKPEPPSPEKTSRPVSKIRGFMSVKRSFFK